MKKSNQEVEMLWDWKGEYLRENKFPPLPIISPNCLV